MNRHSGVAIRYIEERASEIGKGLAYYLNCTEREARAYLDDLKARGYEAVPACDNVDEKGWCKGHP